MRRLLPAEKDGTGADVANYTTLRWAAAAQNDFAARIQWTMAPRRSGGNHPPSVRIEAPSARAVAPPARAGAEQSVRARPGSTVRLRAHVSDPDGDRVTTTWWQYREEGTYPGTVSISAGGAVTIPADAEPGQTISVILQGTDDGQFPLTRYDRVVIRVS